MGTDKKRSDILEFDDDSLNYKIEIATQTLERNIGFIENCDNKASIVLAMIGIVTSIILTNEGLTKIFSIIKTCINEKNLETICYLLVWGASILLIIAGIIMLVRMIVAKTSAESILERKCDSLIYFSSICENNDDKSYNRRFYKQSKEALLDDLIEQIYVNAKIADNKYKKYNYGLWFTIIGFALFIICLILGICRY